MCAFESNQAFVHIWKDKKSKVDDDDVENDGTVKITAILEFIYLLTPLKEDSK